MNHYEILYLISGAVTEDELTPIKQKVSDIISKSGGSISYEGSLGKRKLAYRIEDIRHGYYLLFEFDAEPRAIMAIDRELRLDPEVVRHLITKRKPTTAQSLLKTADEKESEEEVKEPKKEEATPTPSTTKEEPKKEEKKESKDDKANLDNLDEKLDEILKGDIL